MQGSYNKVMGYSQFLGVIDNIVQNIDKPRILEIGIEYGNITIPMLTSLLREGKDFYYYGIDIELKNNVKEFVSSLNNDQIHLIEKNSLIQLPKMQDTFDLVLVDGDHNYYTVSNELKYITNMIHDKSIVICDDYHSIYDFYDYWYSRHVFNLKATRKIQTLKKGVVPAIEGWAQEQGMTIYHMNESTHELIRHDKIDHDDKTVNYCHAVMLKRNINENTATSNF